MKTVQMTLDPGLLAHVDRVARRLGISRSAFTRRALREALDRLRVQALEQRHREGYRQKPVRRGEFDLWESEAEVRAAMICHRVSVMSSRLGDRRHLIQGTHL